PRRWRTETSTGTHDIHTGHARRGGRSSGDHPLSIPLPVLGRPSAAWSHPCEAPPRASPSSDPVQGGSTGGPAGPWARASARRRSRGAYASGNGLLAIRRDRRRGASPPTARRALEEGGRCSRPDGRRPSPSCSRGYGPHGSGRSQTEAEDGPQEEGADRRDGPPRDDPAGGAGVSTDHGAAPTPV